MRKIYSILLIVFIGLVDCKEPETEKYFDPINFDKLNLLDLDGFWNENDSIDVMNNSMGGAFSMQPTYEAGITYRCRKPFKFIEVSVFSNQAVALAAMEFRINSASGVIEVGSSDKIEGQWWFNYEGSYTTLFVNKHNTIITVLYYVNIKNIETILFSTIKEVAKRVDELSVEIE